MIVIHTRSFPSILQSEEVYRVLVCNDQLASVVECVTATIAETRSLKDRKRWIEISQVAGAPRMGPVGTKAENRLVAGRLNYSNALSKIGNGDDQECWSSLSRA